MPQPEANEITNILRKVRSFQVTDQTLESLRQLMEALRGLKDQRFEGKGEFISALATALGDDLTEKFEEAILRLTLVINEDAEIKLEALVEQELRKIAAARMRKEDPGHILETDGLLNEAYIKLKDVLRNPGAAEWENRLHFYKYASRVMGNILVDYARDGRQEVSLSAAANVTITGDEQLSREDLLSLNKALKELEAKKPRPAAVVKLIYFAGLKHEQVAKALNISVATVKRDWNLAKLLLEKELGGNKRKVG